MRLKIPFIIAFEVSVANALPYKTAGSSRLIVFGDSFSDNGNGSWIASKGTWPADPAYYGHSFSYVKMQWRSKRVSNCPGTAPSGTTLRPRPSTSSSLISRPAVQLQTTRLWREALVRILQFRCRLLLTRSTRFYRGMPLEQTTSLYIGSAPTIFSSTRPSPAQTSPVSSPPT